MIIVAGQIRVAARDRERFLTRSREAMQLARSTRGCLDFVVAADPLDAERVNVYERWSDRASLHAFRRGGPDDELRAMIRSIGVDEYDVTSPARKS